jgi:NADH-quinone oxidoreductase subunit L
VTLLLAVALPLVSAALIVAFGRWLGRRLVAVVAVIPVALAFGAALAIAQAFSAGKTSLVAELGPWLPLHGADLVLRIDGASMPLLVTVTAVVTLLSIATALRLDGTSRRAFVGLDLLAVGATLVVTTPDLVLILAGLELSAVATYLLLGLHQDRAADTAAASRSFVIARIGDAALLVAVVVLFAMFRTVDLDEIAQRVGGFSGQSDAVARLQSALFVPSLLVLVAVLARSAQLPFPAWSSAARRAPLAASAGVLLWSASGGAILLLRLAPILPPAMLATAAALGALTAVYAAAVTAGNGDARAAAAWSSVSIGGLLVASAAARVGEAMPFIAVAAVAAAASVALLLSALARRRPLAPGSLARIAASGFELEQLYRLSIVAAFEALARLLGQGSERVIEGAGEVIGSAVVGASVLVRRMDDRYPAADRALAAAAIVALLAYWSLR